MESRYLLPLSGPQMEAECFPILPQMPIYEQHICVLGQKLADYNRLFLSLWVVVNGLQWRWDQSVHFVNFHLKVGLHIASLKPSPPLEGDCAECVEAVRVSPLCQPPCASVRASTDADRVEQNPDRNNSSLTRELSSSFILYS